MPREKGTATNMSSVVRNEMAKAEAFSTTSIVLVKDKKVRMISSIFTAYYTVFLPALSWKSAVCTQLLE
jgi:hypothetical protein